MRGYFLVLCLLLQGLIGLTQQVKKVKINEIEEIIIKSDHPVVISFWATWCLPCIHEIPYLQSTIAKYQDKNVELVLVSLDFRESYPKGIEAFEQYVDALKGYLNK